MKSILLWWVATAPMIVGLALLDIDPDSFAEGVGLVLVLVYAIAGPEVWKLLWRGEEGLRS